MKNLNNKKNALWLDWEIDTFSGAHSLASKALNNDSKKMLFHFFDVLQAIKPISEGPLHDKRYAFWICVPSPTLDEYISANNNTESSMTREEYEEEWKDWYPDEYKWYEITAVTHRNSEDAEPFCGVFIGSDYVLSANDCNEEHNYPLDGSDLISFLQNKTEEIIQKLKEGSYNSWVEQSLPFSYRHGIIARKTLYALFPKMREWVRHGLTEQEIEEFSKIAQADSIPEEEQLPQMTARMFYEACSYGYNVCGIDSKRRSIYKDTDIEHKRYGKVTPKELYYTYADGRDDNLCGVPLDDPNAFLNWFNKKGDYSFNGSHPYEVRGSFSIENSIHLYPRLCKSGKWVFLISCIEMASGWEVVKWTLALHHAHFPVQVYCGKKIADRFLETDLVGVDPDTVWLHIAHSSTYGDDVFDVFELPKEAIRDKKVTDKIHWIPEDQIELEK